MCIMYGIQVLQAAVGLTLSVTAGARAWRNSDESMRGYEEIPTQALVCMVCVCVCVCVCVHTCTHISIYHTHTDGEFSILHA